MCIFETQTINQPNPMKTLVLLLLGLLCSFAAPPGSYAAPIAHTVYAVKATRHAVQAATAAVAAEITNKAAVQTVVAVVACPEPVYSTPTAETSGYFICQRLSLSRPPLRARPGWCSSVGATYTQHKAAALRK